MGVKATTASKTNAVAGATKTNALAQELQGLPLRDLGLKLQSLRAAAGPGNSAFKAALAPAFKAMDAEVARRAKESGKSVNDFLDALELSLSSSNGKRWGVLNHE